MKRIQIKIDWSVIFWIGIIIIFLWLMAKAVGLINTPWYIEIIPYIGALAVLGAIIKKIGEYTYKIDIMFQDIKDIKLDLKDLRLKSENHEVRLVKLETKLS